ncbi:9971_t:CDS:1, partial [Ambispora gerdemannii]
NDQRHKYSRPGRSIFVREETNSLQILPQHLRSPDEINKNSVYLALKVTGMESDHSNKVFVPLIPGYIIYTKLGETYFKLALEWSSQDNNI